MLFNSINYLIFFPTVVCLYFVLPYRYRWVLLLSASYYFYMSWKVEYIFLILFSTIVDYYVGLKMGKAETQAAKRKFLILSIATNLGILFGFKYFNFVGESTRVLLNGMNIFYDVPFFAALLPVGISFYTFQSMSYSIEVYRGNQKPETHFGIFALYVAFFPQLVAGPIERSTHLLPQFYRTFDFDYRRVTRGLRLMTWGLFKKVVIADRLAYFVNSAYDAPREHSGAPFALATFFFAFQIYCDFSGYSDIAIGSAKVMGFSLMDNFRRPYFSESITEFWQRWHISLSSWFRDYLYIPLGGNRVPLRRWAANIMIVFVASGLWHGAAWTFVTWGALHGSYILIGYMISRTIHINSTSKSYRLARVFLTFSLVLFAWIFFRANSVGDAYYIVNHLFDDFGIWDYAQSLSIQRQLELFLSFFFIGALLVFEYSEERFNIIGRFDQQSAWVRWPIYYLILMMILMFGVFGRSEFIYFQF